MKTIKNLKVTVTYIVEFEKVQVSDKVFEQFENNSEFDHNDFEAEEAIDWLADNVTENDSLAWKYEISDVEEL